LLDDHEAVAVGITEREHRRHEVAHPHDLGVGVDALGDQGGVVGFSVGGAEADAGIDSYRGAFRS
jgi:hypothetical protein